MKTTEIEGKTYTVSVAESGELILTPVEKVEERRPRCGDVLASEGLQGFAVCDACYHWKYTTTHGWWAEHGLPEGVFAFNIFDVINGDYVKKQDVIDALSIEDSDGDSCMSCLDPDRPRPLRSAREATRDALAALGIK